MEKFKISTPGRICLFGEHQDYLGLPVIAAAISKRVNIEVNTNSSTIFDIQMPNIQSFDVIDFSQPIKYTHSRDYFRSAINVLKKNGFTFGTGAHCVVNGNIPINSGTSSSSALLCAWMTTLLQLSDQKPDIDRKLIGELSYQAEVVEFNEAGGMMDQYSTSVGDIIYLESRPKIHIEFLQPKLGKFVLGDSGQPKDTQGILSWVKYGMLDIIEKVSKHNPLFNLFNTPFNEIVSYKTILTTDQYNLLSGNISDRDLLRQAKAMMEYGEINHEKLGEMLYKHHESLRDAKKVSTPKIDKMINAAMAAGAYGGKINGSGGGGCMFAYAPKNTENVAEAIETAGGKAYIIDIDKGTTLEYL